MKDYIIWSFERNAWWGPYSEGFYVTDVAKAGRYSAEVAGEIVTNSVLCDDIAIWLPMFAKMGTPRFHPYKGERR